MAIPMRLTIALFFILCFISTAFGKCGVKDLVIGAVRSGREIQGKPEWNVQIHNPCNCSLAKISLVCRGFKTVEAIDPSIFREIGSGLFSVNDGRPLEAHADIRFSYAWDPPAIHCVSILGTFCPS